MKTAQDHNPYLALDDVSLYAHVYKHVSEHTAVAELILPTVHCASCVRTLETWPSLQKGLIDVKIDFSQQRGTFRFDPSEVKLSTLAHLLEGMGFPPDMSLASAETVTKGRSPHERKALRQLAVAGFVSGNTMLFALPEYFGLSPQDDLSLFIRGITALLSIPLVLVSSEPFFVSAWGALKNRTTNMDVPIALGIVALFVKSHFDVWTGYGPGYFDSLAGLLFFLLIGRWFQSRTFAALHFERDYKSFFPFSAWVIENGKEVAKPLESLQKGNLLRVRHGELIPVDGKVIEGISAIDTAFITGESQPEDVFVGDDVPAGAKVAGGALTIEVTRALDQRYLTSLWSEDTDGHRPIWTALTDRLGRSFTGVVLGLSAVSALVWAFIDPSRIVLVVTSILIVACPCALALSVPFSLGNTVRWLGRHGAFVKSTLTVERLAKVNAWIFDKTGTLTVSGVHDWDIPREWPAETTNALVSLANQSAHPLSRSLVQFGELHQWKHSLKVQEFQEELGRGLQGLIEKKKYTLGSPSFCQQNMDEAPAHALGAMVDGQFLGYMVPKGSFREGLAQGMQQLSPAPLAVLTGDSAGEEDALRQHVSEKADIRFRQKPEEKKVFVANWQSKGYTVAMVGDGLNDAGALSQSDVGITVAEDAMHFAPACDILLRANALPSLHKHQLLAQAGVRAVRLSMIMSLAYNITGLTWAVRGALTPEVSAILMPISSLSVVAFTTLYTRRAAAKIFAKP